MHSVYIEMGASKKKSIGVIGFSKSFRHVSDTINVLHLCQGQCHLQDRGGDPSFVFTIHQPSEFALAIGQRLDGYSSRTVPGSHNFGIFRAGRMLDGTSGTYESVILGPRLHHQDKVPGRDNVTWTGCSSDLVGNGNIISHLLMVVARII